MPMIAGAALKLPPLRWKLLSLSSRARSAGDFCITCPVKTGTSPALHLPFTCPFTCPHKHLQRCLWAHLPFWTNPSCQFCRIVMYQYLGIHLYRWLTLGFFRHNVVSIATQLRNQTWELINPDSGRFFVSLRLVYKRWTVSCVNRRD